MRVFQVDSTKEAYDMSQDGRAKNGDIFVVPSEEVIGISWTWPVAITEAHGELHTINPDFTVEGILEDFLDSVDMAERLKKGFGYK